MPATRIQVNDDGSDVELTNAAFYLSTLAPLNVAPQRFPVQAPHWVFDVIEPELDPALRQGGALQRRPARDDVARPRPAGQRRRPRSSTGSASSKTRPTATTARWSPSTRRRPRCSSTSAPATTSATTSRRPQRQRRPRSNSPGSTLKPFTYAAAFEDLGWGPDTEILDTPITYPDGDKDFTPRNPCGDFHGIDRRPHRAR